MFVVCIFRAAILFSLLGGYAQFARSGENRVLRASLISLFFHLDRSTADVAPSSQGLESPHPLHPYSYPLPLDPLLLLLMHPPMPLQLIAPRERFPTPWFEARVLALGRVHSEVFRQVGRFRKGGGTAGEGAREGARTGVRACWRAVRGGQIVSVK